MIPVPDLPTIRVHLISERGSRVPAEMTVGAGPDRRTIDPYKAITRYGIGTQAAGADHMIQIDPGASVTMIPKHIWGGHQDKISWCHEPGVTPHDDLPGLTYPIFGVGGGQIRVYFGIVTLRLYDCEDATRYLTLKLLAAFHAEGELNRALLGLGGGAFWPNGLCLNGDQLHKCPNDEAPIRS